MKIDKNTANSYTYFEKHTNNTMYIVRRNTF